MLIKPEFQFFLNSTHKNNININKDNLKNFCTDLKNQVGEYLKTCVLNEELQIIYGNVEKILKLFKKK